MNLGIDPGAWDRYVHRQHADPKIAPKINGLIEECLRHPFEGTGKPEPLRGDLAGYGSRRIDRAHRLVYRVTQDEIVIVQCRYHY
jgi:toxin YoeB